MFAFPVFIVGGLLLAFGPPSESLWTRLIMSTPFVRIPVGLGAAFLFGSFGVLQLRLWRGEPLVEVTGRTMTIAAPWGRHSIDRGEIKSLGIWTRSAQQFGLEVQLKSGKRRRIGFEPSGTNWYRVLAALDEWKVA